MKKSNNQRPKRASWGDGAVGQGHWGPASGPQHSPVKSWVQRYTSVTPGLVEEGENGAWQPAQLNCWAPGSMGDPISKCEVESDQEGQQILDYGLYLDTLRHSHMNMYMQHVQRQEESGWPRDCQVGLSPRKTWEVSVLRCSIRCVQPVTRGPHGTLGSCEHGSTQSCKLT